MDPRGLAPDARDRDGLLVPSAAAWSPSLSTEDSLLAITSLYSTCKQNVKKKRDAEKFEMIW